MTDPQAPFDPPASATALTPVPPNGPGSPAVVAFYLPQYHRIPENDAWWGEGFTDWTNVTAAQPLYPGHAIPNLPGELGAYDLLSRDVRSAQAKLAREHGVYGFCYYFYWFGGRRLLQRPLELMLEDGQPDLPFALCWANEPWTRRWDGREQDVLLPQQHDRVRDLAILDDLVPYLEDPRYIRIDGRPLLLIYRQGLMPDAPGFAADLRAEAVRRGLPGLFLCNVLSIGDIERCAPGFDAAVEFPPHGTIGKEIRARDLGADHAYRGHIYDYASTVLSAVARPTPSYPCFPGVMPRWDNTARKGLRAHTFHGSTPEFFERWLRRASLDTRRRNPRSPLLFVNSWNEWAEGAHLEPDQRTGRTYLEAVHRVVMAPSNLEDATGPLHQKGRDPTRHSAQEMEAGGGFHMTPLLSGLPIEAASWTEAGGAGWIEEVDGLTLEGFVIQASCGQKLRLRGWFYGDAREGRRAGSAYIVVSYAGASWHALLTERHRRTDVLRGKLATNHRKRKLIRALDRVTATVGWRVLSLLARRRDRFGFDILVDLDGLPQGTWAIGFAEVASPVLNAVATPFALRCEA
jgi:hypothetical protein